MKRILLLISILFIFSLALISCGSKECEHNFTSASCVAPKTCTLCGETEGDATEHSFAPATCTAPKTCVSCGVTDGVANNHIFNPATCKAPKTCIYCKTAEGEVGVHNWKNASCLSPSTCRTCGITEGEAPGHDWTSTLCTKNKICKACGEREEAKEHTWNVDMCLETPICIECKFIGSEIQHEWTGVTCLSPKTCTRCGEIGEEALGHSWKVTSCKEPKVCQRCNISTTEDLPHIWVYNGCEEERTCADCAKKEGIIYGHKWIDATCIEAKHCETCYAVEGEPIPHNWQNATCTFAKFCDYCETIEGEPLGHIWRFISTKEALCEGEKDIYFCDRCKRNSEKDKGNAIYGYHICDASGLCSQCNQIYDTSKMVLESVLITNEYSVEFCGIFTSEEATVDIYKPITSIDVGMPVVNIGGSLPTSKGYVENVAFTYDSEELSFDCVAEIKVQGASSAGYPKKNFNIKLFNESGTKHKVELVDGWGKENKYCMKANYIDYSQSRNVVSAKIFGEIVKSRNDELVNTPNGGAIDGYPILVYNNGVYQGVYTMNIPKDKWMLDMHDSEEKNQAIFMTETWNKAVSFREVSTSGFVLEYASNEDSLIDNSTQWAYDSMLALIEFVYNNDGEDFKNGIHQYADIDKCIDSMIYTFFICADDNTSKNILWVTYDGKVWFSSMYDMDGTWGMRWNGNIEFDENTHPISALVDGKGLAPERNHDNMNLLWERIYVNYFDRVCQRYLELRQEILTLENITNHFEAFFDAIPGAVREAEKQKWTGVPSQWVDHLEQILTFAEKRLEVMDKILLVQE